MSNRFIGPLLSGGLLLLAVLTPATAPAAPVKFACSPTKMAGSASVLNGSTTTSQFPAFVNIPQAVVSFTQGGVVASCVIVRFSAQTYAPAGRSIVVRAFLDNATTAVPAWIEYSGNDASDNHARSYDFVFPSVAVGAHLVCMQFSSTTTAFVGVNYHTTIVQYK